MTRVLALDTTTLPGSAAIVEDDRVIEERAGDADRSHGERLPEELHALLAAHGLHTSDVDVFAVAAGPGSFTGLRIGIATMQGLAFVHRCKMAAVSALEALAHVGSQAHPPGVLVGAWIDARRRDVFSALYRVGPGPSFQPDRLVAIEAPQVGSPAAALDRWQHLAAGEPIICIGDGTILWEDLIRSRVPGALVIGHPLLAGAIGRLGSAAAAAGRVIDAGAVRPLYVRKPDAELARERQLLGAGSNARAPAPGRRDNHAS